MSTKCKDIVKIKIIYQVQYNDMIDDNCVVKGKCGIRVAPKCQGAPFGAMTVQLKPNQKTKNQFCDNTFTASIIFFQLK
jgi:hypothetical protein